MIDPDFDPYGELQLAKKNIMELARAFNQQQDIIQQLLEQNRKLNNLISLNRRELHNVNCQITEILQRL